MDLSIVIVTYYSADVLGECLRAIGPALRESVLVVDNGSTDATVSIAHSHGVHVVELGHNTGFAAAANFGAERATGRTLCFLNPDTVPEPGLFAEGLEALRLRPGDCAVPRWVGMGKTIAEGRQPGYTRRRLLADILMANYGIGAASSSNTPEDRQPPWYWPLGTCLFISRARFQELGGFDTRYFMYMEDVDFGWRLHRAGGQVIPLDTPLVHHGAKGTSVPRKRQMALLNRGRIRYGTLHYGRFFGMAVALLAAPAALLPQRTGP